MNENWGFFCIFIVYNWRFVVSRFNFFPLGFFAYIYIQYWSLLRFYFFPSTLVLECLHTYTIYIPWRLMPFVLFSLELFSVRLVSFVFVGQATVVAGKDKGPPLKLDLDITSEELEKKLRECLASRGRKATDPKVRSVCTTLI